MSVLVLVTVLVPTTMLNLNAESFNPHRDYFKYHHGNGDVTIKFEHLKKCDVDQTLKHVTLYEVKGEGADVHTNENDDVLIPVKSVKHDKITWNIDEDAYYYINLDDNSRDTAFGSDLISCYLWFNHNEDAEMHLDVRELNL